MTTGFRPHNAERFTATYMDVTGLEHVHRYQLACLLTKAKDVLDIACGAGYGAWMIAQQARRVFGVDASDDVVAHATRRYRRDNLTFHRGFCADIPLHDESVDVVVSYETLEHIFEQAEFLDECRRVLRPDGVLIISTPNLDVYNHGWSAPNPFHVKELTPVEFETALRRVFPNVVFGMQGLGFGSLVTFPRASTLHHSELLHHPHPSGMHEKLATYCIAVASAIPTEEIPHGFCAAPVTVAEEFRHMAAQIELLRHARALDTEQEAAVSALRDALTSAHQQITSIHASTSWRVTRLLRVIGDYIKTRKF